MSMSMSIDNNDTNEDVLVGEISQRQQQQQQQQQQKNKKFVKNTKQLIARSPSTDRLLFTNSKRPRASFDGLPLEADDCHPRAMNSKRFLSDAMANELGWKWSLEDTLA